MKGPTDDSHRRILLATFLLLADCVCALSARLHFPDGIWPWFGGFLLGE